MLFALLLSILIMIVIIRTSDSTEFLFTQILRHPLLPIFLILCFSCFPDLLAEMFYKQMRIVIFYHLYNWLETACILWLCVRILFTNAPKGYFRMSPTVDALLIFGIFSVASLLAKISGFEPITGFPVFSINLAAILMLLVVLMTLIFWQHAVHRHPRYTPRRFRKRWEVWVLFSCALYCAVSPPYWSALSVFLHLNLYLGFLNTSALTLRTMGFAVGVWYYYALPRRITLLSFLRSHFSRILSKNNEY